MISKFPLEFGTLFANTSLGNLKSKYHRQLLITSMFAELNNFMKNRTTAKSRDLTCHSANGVQAQKETQSSINRQPAPYLILSLSTTRLLMEEVVALFKLGEASNKNQR